MKGYFPTARESWPVYLRDSVLAAYLTPFILSGVSIIVFSLFSTHDALKTVTNFDSLTGLDTALPLLSSIASLPSLLIATSLLGSAILLLYKYFKKWKSVVIFLCLFILIAAIPQERSVTDYLLTLGESVFVLAGMTLVILFVLRKNVLSYVLLVYVSIFLAGGLAYLDQPKMFYMLNGAILLFLAFLPVLLYMLRNLRRKKGNV